mmetsp:Transcript_12695/g.45072  ORF Transcript_12695/g.45072 Transcript_12695/m.45072 type:complete len:916 (-) Transcript_12695:8-2755(-)
MLVDERAILVVPLGVLFVSLRDKRAVPSHLCRNLRVVLRLQVSKLVLVLVLQRVQPVLVVELHAPLVLHQLLVASSVGAELGCELVRDFGDALLVLHVLEPELVLVVQHELVDLQTQLQHLLALVLQVGLGHQNLLCELGAAGRVAVHRAAHHLAAAVELVDLEEGERAVDAGGEEEEAVVRESHAGDGVGVRHVPLRLQLLPVVARVLRLHRVRRDEPGRAVVGRAHEEDARVGRELGAAEERVAELGLCRRHHLLHRRRAAGLVLLRRGRDVAERHGPRVRADEALWRLRGARRVGRRGRGRREELADGPVVRDAEDAPKVRRGGASEEGAAGEHVLAVLGGLAHLPHEDGAVAAHGDEAAVAARPADAADAAVVAPQVGERLVRVRGDDLDHGVVRGRKGVPAVRKGALAARLDVQLVHRPDVVHQERHEPQFVRKPDEDVEPRRVQRHAQGLLLLKPLHQLDGALLVVPDADGAVRAARRDERFPDADVHGVDLGGAVWAGAVERRAEEVKVHRVLLEDVRVAEGEGVHLVVVRRAEQRLLRWRDNEVPNAAARPAVLNAEDLEALERLADVLRPLVDPQRPGRAAADKALGVGTEALDARRRLAARRQHHSKLVVLVQDQVARRRRRHQPLFREPAVAGVALRLPLLVRRDGPELRLGDAHELEQPLAGGADDGRILRAKVHLIDHRALRDARRRHGLGRAVERPEHELPLGRAALGQAQLGVAGEGDVDHVFRAEVGVGEHLPPFARRRVVNVHHAALRRPLRHGQVLAVRREGHGRDATARQRRRYHTVDQLLLLGLRVVQDDVVAARVRHSRLLHKVHQPLHVALEAEDVPLRQNRVVAHGAQRHRAKRPPRETLPPRDRRPRARKGHRRGLAPHQRPKGEQHARKRRRGRDAPLKAALSAAHAQVF